MKHGYISFKLLWNWEIDIRCWIRPACTANLNNAKKSSNIIHPSIIRCNAESNGIDDLTLGCRLLFEQSTMCLHMDQTSSASEVTNQRISCWYGCQIHNSKNSVVLFCSRYHLIGRNFVHYTSYNVKNNLGNTLIIWGWPTHR